MTFTTLPATLMRGGTSKGLFFRADQLPDDPARVQALLMRALGSPDPYGGQLDGLGTGISSTSKIVIIGPSQQPAATWTTCSATWPSPTRWWIGPVTAATSTPPCRYLR